MVKVVDRGRVFMRASCGDGGNVVFSLVLSCSLTSYACWCGVDDNTVPQSRANVLPWSAGSHCRLRYHDAGMWATSRALGCTRE